MIFFIESIRNFGERTINLFSRKKKSTEQTAQNVVDDVNEAASNIKNDAIAVGTSAGLLLFPFFFFKYLKKKIVFQFFLFLALNS